MMTNKVVQKSRTSKHGAMTATWSVNEGGSRDTSQLRAGCHAVLVLAVSVFAFPENF